MVRKTGKYSLSCVSYTTPFSGDSRELDMRVLEFEKNLKVGDGMSTPKYDILQNFEKVHAANLYYGLIANDLRTQSYEIKISFEIPKVLNFHITYHKSKNKAQSEYDTKKIEQIIENTFEGKQASAKTG